MAKNRSVLKSVVKGADESSKGGFSEKLVEFDTLDGLDALRSDPLSYIQDSVERGIPEDSTLRDVNDSYRSEALLVSMVDEDADELYSKAMDLTVKYAEFAKGTFSGRKGEFRINPFKEYVPMAERADAWVRDVIQSGSFFVDEALDGKRYIFISEDALGFQVALALLRVRMRMDVRSQLVQIGLTDGTWVNMDDFRESALKSKISREFRFAKHLAKGIKAVPAFFRELMWRNAKETHLSDNTVDSFEQWLSQLPSWDGVERVDDWLHQAGLRFTDETDLDLLSWVSRTILLVACKRVLKPGMKHDIMPVLIGDQGLGKSTALAFLFPEDERTQWFKDELRLNDDSKHRIESIQGSVIVEVAEMAGATNADIESLKAFLSRQVDHARLAYRRNTEPMPRMCSLVGSANRSMLPNDPTGNRRFVALFVEQGDPGEVRRWLDANRLQLWSEAWTRAKKGERVLLGGKLAHQQANTNEMARSADDLLEGIVEAWLVKHRQSNVSNHFTLAEAAEGCGMVRLESMAGSLPVGEGRRLGRVLKTLGCGKTRIVKDGYQVRVWLYPAHIEQAGQKQIEIDEVEI